MTFYDQIEQAILKMPMWESKTITGKDKYRILDAVRRYIREGRCKGFMLEIDGDTIRKYRTLTTEEVKEWNKQYYSEERVKMREDPNWIKNQFKDEKRRSTK